VVENSGALRGNLLRHGHRAGRLRAAVTGRQTVNVGRRWPNMGLFGLNFVIVWLCIPVSAVEVAQRAGSGPLVLLPVNAGIGIVLGVLALDLWKYCEHRVMHSFSPVWRFHLVHHTDTDVDFTTTERHHPIEVAFSSVILLAVIYVLAVPPLAVVTFVLFGTVVAFASHANLRLPARIDRILRRLIVTPSVHVIHHSALRDETDSNYGAIFTVWDRLFGRTASVKPTPFSVEGLESFARQGTRSAIRCCGTLSCIGRCPQLLNPPARLRETMSAARPRNRSRGMDSPY
jgi:sterol desaturase/sphingolipid hydroxylase (fatty acid hydroxylase superfamily)